MDWLSLILGILGGLVVGFILARYLFKSQLKKNPPVNERMIRLMFAEMGRKPSEAQIQKIVRQMNSQIK